MQVPITKKLLVDWAGAQTVRDAESLVDRGLVLEAEYEAPMVRGAILYNNRALKTSLKHIALKMFFGGGLVRNAMFL